MPNMGGGGGSPPPAQPTTAPSGACSVQACHDWTWDGCAQDGTCCSSWRTDSIADLSDWFGNDGMSSSRVSGCEDHLVQAFEHGSYGGSSVRMPGGFTDYGNWNDKMSSIKFTAIPKSLDGKLSADTNSACPGSTDSYEKSGGKRYRCFYSSSDGSGLETLKNSIGSDGEMSAMYTDLTNRFCAISGNFTQKVGGGETCASRNTGSQIAKEYCSVGDRMVEDGACTKENLGGLYDDTAVVYCKGAGKSKSFCSCYNVKAGVCDTDSTAAGCATKKQKYDKLVEATPEGFRHVWAGKETCFGVCSTGEKMYLPSGYDIGCDAPVQICAQSFDLDNISESSIEAKCELSATQGTQPSAGDGSGGGGAGAGAGAGAGSGGGAGGGGGAGAGAGGGVNDYIPRSLDELRTDSKKQLAVGGVGSLFMICCCLLIIILLASSGGGGGGGPTRFRR